MNGDRVVGAAKELGGKAESALGDAIGDTKLQADGVVDQVKGAAQQVYGQAKDVAAEYTDQARELAGGAIERGRRYVDEGMDRYPAEAERYYREGRKAVAQQIEHSPLASILIAGAVGYALALLVHSRR